jgi:hypothetical protein
LRQPGIITHEELFAGLDCKTDTQRLIAIGEVVEQRLCDNTVTQRLHLLFFKRVGTFCYCGASCDWMHPFAMPMKIPERRLGRLSIFVKGRMHLVSSLRTIKFH